MVRNAGRLRDFIKEWRKITKDVYILEAVSGFRIPFLSEPMQVREPKIPNYNLSDEELISESIDKLLKSGAIVESEEEVGQFVSTIFTVPKPDGSRRPIINLKKLNEFIENPHFKMESIKTASLLVSKNCKMAVIDLKDAYHAIPVHKDFQKYLKFRWQGKLYKYVCIAFGLCLAPFLYTTLNKPIIAYLRSNGVLLVSYLDDTLIIGKDKKECEHSVNLAVSLFRRLGLVVNEEKSVLEPHEMIRFLGFMINSKTMRLSLPEEKIERVIRKCEEILQIRPSILQIAELVGMLVAASPATKYGMLYTKQLEIEKTEALTGNYGNYSRKMFLSDLAREDVNWWIENLKLECRSLIEFCPHVEMYTDASKSGWGASLGDLETKGGWPEHEKELHINVQELLGVYYALLSLVKEQNVNILLRVDSSTALAYINNFGGCRSKELHDVAKKIWRWCEERGIMLHASYINTKENVVADRLSKAAIDYSDFSLGSQYFQEICHNYGTPKVDYFATCHTKQCERYYSYKPDPGSEGVDAFTFRWENEFYAFPPFNLVGKVLQKLVSDEVSGIVVAPCWATQAWFPIYQKLAVSEILILGPNENLLFDPYSREKN